MAIRGRWLTNEVVEEIRARKAQGWLGTRIAKRLGISVSTVYKYLEGDPRPEEARKNGLEQTPLAPSLRPQHELGDRSAAAHRRLYLAGLTVALFLEEGAGEEDLKMGQRLLRGALARSSQALGLKG